MRCRACDRNLTDREASRKFLSWKDIPNPEERYIGLCEKGGCLRESGLEYEEDPRASQEAYEDSEDVLDDAEPFDEQER